MENVQSLSHKKWESKYHVILQQALRNDAQLHVTMIGPHFGVDDQDEADHNAHGAPKKSDGTIA